MGHLYLKTCEICGKEFESLSPKKRICYEDHYKQCPYCGTQVLWNSYLEFHGCKPCIYQEATKKRKVTMQEKYGAPTSFQSEELRNKAKETWRGKYGENVTNPMKSQKIKNKVVQTCIEKYGVDNPMKSKEIAAKSRNSRITPQELVLEKIKQTWLQKYGVDNVFKSEEIKEKIRQTLQERYGVEHPMASPEIRNKFEQTCMQKYGFPYYVLTDEYRHLKYCRNSKTNIDFGKHLEEHGIHFRTEYSISRRSYDFFIPERDLLIEINPSYTHSILGTHWNEVGTPKYYHVDKTKLAEENKLSCLHVWDWDTWDTLIEMYLPRNKLDASELEVFRLNVESCNEFLMKNDNRPVPKNQSLCLGLVKDQQIYQVMTFGRSKHQSKYMYQIYRTCTKLDYEIIGGWDVLSSEASKVFGVTSCIAYADVSKPMYKHVYEDIGMNLQKRNPPNLLWSKNKEVKWDRFESSHDPDAHEHLISDKWLPVYDCGTDVYIFE